MLTKIKVYACYIVKIYKNKPQKFLKTGGRAPGAPVLDPPLGNMYNGYFDMNLALSAEYQALRKTYMFRVKPFNFV